jgi:outer membrane protein insertion porin family
MVYPGEVYDTVKIRQSERVLQNMGFFGNIRTRPVPTPAGDEKDLVVEVEEKRTGQVMVGAGFSSVDNLMGFVELSQGNFDLQGWPWFTGGGQKLKLGAQVGTENQRYDFSFVEPWFLDRKLSLGFDVWRSDRDYDDYDLQQTGVAVELGKPLPGPHRVAFRYQLENSAITDESDTNEYIYADPPQDPYSFTREEDTTKSSLRLTLTRDTRNNPFIPSEGNRVSLYGESAGGPLGFDTDLYEFGLITAHYKSLWWEHVISLRLNAQVVEEYGDTEELTISDRLFLGGGRTLRGFEYRDVGPKVIPVDPTTAEDDHRPVGGQTLAMARAEYTIPIVKYVRWAAFYDVGNVWRDPYDFDFSVLASSVGTGIRLDIPGFPIRVDYGWAIKKDSELTDTDPWVVWIGYDN